MASGAFRSEGEKHMPKWQINLTRDTSQDAEVVIEAETAEEAKQFFLHDMDHDLIQWREAIGSATPTSSNSSRLATTRNSRLSMPVNRSQGLMTATSEWSSLTSPARSTAF